MPLPSTQVIGAQPSQRRFPKPGLQSLAHVGKLLHVARLAMPESARPQGRAMPARCAARPEALGHEQQGARRTRRPMCRMTISPRATQAKSPKPRRELGCTCGLFRQRGVRIAEKLGQAPSDSCVVSSGVFLAECGGQYSQQAVCPRRSAVAQRSRSRSWAACLMRSWHCTKASVPSGVPSATRPC